MQYRLYKRLASYYSGAEIDFSRTKYVFDSDQQAYDYARDLNRVEQIPPYHESFHVRKEGVSNEKS